MCISQEAEEAAEKKAEAEQAAAKKAEEEAAAKKKQEEAAKKTQVEEAAKRQAQEVRPHESAWLALPIIRAGTGLTCAIRTGTALALPGRQLRWDWALGPGPSLPHLFRH